MTKTPVAGPSDLPIFVEMTQVTLLQSAESQGNPIAGRPNDVFAFLAGSSTLLLRPGITVPQEAEVLIGLAQVIQGPTGDLVKGDLFQIPGADAPLEVIEIEGLTGELRLAYGELAFELSPGQTRTFKRPLAEHGAVEITTITNQGPLGAIEALAGQRGGR